MLSKIVRTPTAGLVCTLISAGPVGGRNAVIEVIGLEGKPRPLGRGTRGVEDD
jgi:hypothetical protein